jgi:hypothetical protein
LRRFYLLTAALLVLLGSCGGTATETIGDQAAATGTGTEANQSDAPDDATETDSSELDLGEDGELSLDDFIPGARAFDEDTDFRAQEMEAQQKIAECMAAEGFDYIPWVPSEVGGGFVFDELDEEEYVKTYGFGVSTWVIQEEEMFGEDGEDPWSDDPNQEIVEAMDEFEQEEYFRVLYGGEPDIIANTPPEEIEAMTEEQRMAFFDEAYMNWEPDGCQNEAYEELYGGGEADMAFWEEFGEDFEDIWVRAEADPRIIEANASWSGCMADKGYDWATQEDMYAYFWGTEKGGEWVEGEFQQKVNEVMNWPDPMFDEETTIPVEDTGGEEGEDGEWEYQRPEYDLEELQPLIDEEIAIATANYECSRDMQKIQEEVYKDVERQWIEENLDRLLAFKEQNG